MPNIVIMHIANQKYGPRIHTIMDNQDALFMTEP